MQNTIATKPSELLSPILDFCPETEESQDIIKFEEDGNFNLIIETKGETTSWRHKITIETEEI